MAMFSWIRGTVMLAATVGLIVGIAAVLGAEQMDHYTNTDAFCTSCHLTGEYIAKSEVYLTSSLQTRSSGVRPGCADCHIP